VDAVDIKQGCRRRWRWSGNNLPSWFVNNTDTGLNINIRRNNLDDVRQLTEIAHDCESATDDHINESPLLEQDEHSSTQTKSVTYIEDGWPAVEETN
jgi:hypothetical protein